MFMQYSVTVVHHLSDSPLNTNPGITYESLDQCDVLVEFLTERLKKNSPQIKLKVISDSNKDDG